MLISLITEKIMDKNINHNLFIFESLFIKNISMTITIIK